MPYNPYGNPYPNYGALSYGYQPQKPLFDFVSGIEGAKSYQIGPAQTAFLFDTENSACYIKTANGMGLPTIEYYKVAKCSEQDIRGASQPSAQFATAEQLSAFEKRLSAIEEAMKPKEAK